MDSSAQDLLNAALGFVRDYAAENLHVSLRTNVLPEFQVSTIDLLGGDSPAGDGVLDLLGLKAAVIVRDTRGRTVASFGEPPAIDPLRVALLLASIALVVGLIVRGLRR